MELSTVWNPAPEHICMYICLCAYGHGSKQGDKVQWSAVKPLYIVNWAGTTPQSIILNFNSLQELPDVRSSWHSYMHVKWQIDFQILSTNSNKLS